MLLLLLAVLVVLVVLVVLAVLVIVGIVIVGICSASASSSSSLASSNGRALYHQAGQRWRIRAPAPGVPAARRRVRAISNRVRIPVHDVRD